MHKNPYIIISITFATICIIFYALACFLYNKSFNQGTMINIIVNAFQVVCGVLIIGSIFYENINKYIKDMTLYIFIAGAALIVSSIQTLYKIIVNMFE